MAIASTGLVFATRRGRGRSEFQTPRGSILFPSKIHRPQRNVVLNSFFLKNYQLPRGFLKGKQNISHVFWGKRQNQKNICFPRCFLDWCLVFHVFFVTEALAQPNEVWPHQRGPLWTLVTVTWARGGVLAFVCWVFFIFGLTKRSFRVYLCLFFMSFC